MIIEAVLLGIIVFNGFKIFLIGLSFVISITLNVIMAVLIIIGMIAAYRWVRRVTSNSDRNQQED
jgi:membrane protein implicated in regulation of membrane protease activity